MTVTLPQMDEVLTLLRQVHTAVVTPAPPVAPLTRVGPPSLYPRADLTPGAINPLVTQANIHETIGVPGWTSHIRPPVTVTSKIKVERFAAYGYAGKPLADAELDHLISLELGGSPDAVENLWPQLYTTPGTTPNVGAHEKDHVENFLHRSILAGIITLAEAQRQIVEDWYAVYLRLEKHGLLPTNTTFDPPGH